MYQKTTLNNGLRLITSRVPTSRSVCVAFFLGVGSRYEKAPQSGMSHFVEHLCFKGTERRPSSKDVCAPIEAVGGMINGGTDKEMTLYWCKVALPNFSLALDVLVDMLRNPLFKAEDVEKERKVITEEINMILDVPDQMVDLLMDQIMWPNHPLGWDVAGTKKTVASFQRARLLKHWSQYYVPGNMVLVVAGDLEHKDILSQVIGKMGDWSGAAEHKMVPANDAQEKPRALIAKRDIEQTHLSLSLRAYHAKHPDRFAMDLLNVILGEGMTSRLFLTVREQLSLAYEIHSSSNHFLDTGSLSVYAGVEPDRLEEAMGAILGQLSMMRDGVPQDELTKAKEFSKGRLLLRMEDTRAIAGWLGGQEALLDRILTVDDVVAQVDAVTIEDIKRVARDIVVPAGLNLVVVGPVRQTRKRLESLLKLS